MQQMTHGNTKFTGTPRLTAFPIGNNCTPGLIANSLFQIYTPSYGPKSLNIERKEVKKVDEDKISNQTGSGEPEKKVNTSELLKRKLEKDVFQKMMHPTFKVSKLEPRTSQQEKMFVPKAGNGSLKQAKQEKKYHKF